MELTAKHQDYWHRNLVVTAVLLSIWFITTFVVAWPRWPPKLPQ